LSEPENAATGGRRGVMLVVSSPSGAGKTTLTRRLIASDPDIELSVSVTTRARRRNERDRKDYHFISVEEFERMRAAGELLESADVFGNLYGTPRPPVLAALEAGRDVLFDIDWQGTRQIRKAAPGDVASVFILPPSAGELMSRLVRRAQDTIEVIRRRLSGAVGEVEHWDEYDYVIVNDDLDAAFDQLRAVLVAERLRVARRRALEAHVAGLREDLLGRLD
jgi:guanylate kinase